MSENVILDWSGTVVDDLGPVLEATNKIFRDFGRQELSLEEFRRQFRLPFSEFYAELLPEATMEGLEELYHRFFVGLQDNVKLLPGALPFLEFCQRSGRRVFLLSTIRADHWERQSSILNVAHYFEHAYVGVLDKREKILSIIQERQLDPARTLFVGDMVHDIETARHGGVLAVAVLSGFDPKDKLTAARPDVLLGSLADLHRLLDARKVFSMSGPTATVGALVFDPGGSRVLMVRTTKWSGLWGIAGGKIRRGETAEDALTRETAEETGLELRDIRFALCQDCVDSPEFFRPAHFLLLNYTARATTTDVRLNHEAVEHRWVTLREALNLPLNQPTRKLIEHVLNNV